MAKTNITAVLNVHRPNKKGLCALRVRTTIQRKVSYYSAGILLLPDQFIDGKIVNHPLKDLLNTKLRKKINDVEKELLELEIVGSATMQKKVNLKLKFTDYAKKKINEWKSTQDSTTIRHKESYLNKINEFNPAIKLIDFDNAMLSRVEEFCRSKGNNDNTVWSCTKFIKTVINAAVADGTLTVSPIKGFKGVKYLDPFRETLSADEITKLEDFANNPLNSPKLLNAANWFLFSCYCGLRYGDLTGFIGFKNGKVLLKTEKTGEVVSIFVTEKILEAKNRLTREIFTNQKSNEYIKIVMAALGINKKISFHNARHTFAVQFLERGGRLEILSKILGHSSIKTTQIYARISTKLADQEMQMVWDIKKPGG